MTSLERLLRSAVRRSRIRRRLPRLPIQAENVLAVACTGHGASLAFLGRDGTVRCSVLDRWAGEKNTLLFSAREDHGLRSAEDDTLKHIGDVLSHGFLGRLPPTRVFEETIVPWTEWLLADLGLGIGDVDTLVASDTNFAVHGWELGPRLHRWFPRARIVSEIEHHRIHQCQAFWQSGFEEAAVVTLDTCGEPLDRLGGRMLSGSISRWRRGGEPEVLSELLYPESSAGLVYDVVTRHLGFTLAEHGKTMGLAPYGRPDLFERLRPELKLFGDGSFAFLDEPRLAAALAGHVPQRRPGGPLEQRHMDVAYLGQAVVEHVVAHAFAAALELTGLRDLAYAGGLALNSVANTAARNRARPRGLYVAPNPGDAGHALGAALWGAHEVEKWPPPAREMPEYLGPSYGDGELEAAVRGCGFETAREDRERGAEIAARLIANGHILARFDGRAEFGPRALGNRSILCDPRRDDMKDELNARVKHREAFRPFAPTVLEEHAGDWFELEGPSPYMLRVVPVRDAARGRIPAVTHVDGSARVQTLARGQNPGYHRLIAAFHRLTGVPMVLNTSFNVAGKPICETPADAVACFAGTAVDVLVLGPYLLSKRPLATYLETSREQGVPA